MVRLDSKRSCWTSPKGHHNRWSLTAAVANQAVAFDVFLLNSSESLSLASHGEETDDRRHPMVFTTIRITNHTDCPRLPECQRQVLSKRLPTGSGMGGAARKPAHERLAASRDQTKSSSALLMAHQGAENPAEGILPGMGDHSRANRPTPMSQNSEHQPVHAEENDHLRTLIGMG